MLQGGLVGAIPTLVHGDDEVKWTIDEPTSGDTRTRNRFALFPTRIEGNPDIRVWLERYVVQQRYVNAVGWFTEKRMAAKSVRVKHEMAVE